MNLSEREIQHIANLARLDLSAKELDVYGDQLSRVLDYIKQLEEVDISATEPTAQVTGLADVLRADEIKEWSKDEVLSALEDAPELLDGQIKVRKVLE